MRCAPSISLHRADARREFPWPPRQPRQSHRQRSAEDAALPARGARGRHRARLGQGDGHADRGGGPLERRPDARDDGVLQRLVRPHAGDRVRRHRSDRRHEAAAVDRLDPHRAGPGRAASVRTRNGTTSRPRLAPRARRCCAATGCRRQAPMGPVYINLDAGMQEMRMDEPLRADRSHAVSYRR